jgi:hypothetical protein
LIELKGFVMPENPQEDNIQVHVSPELEYVYRDVINIFVGAGDVILEMGNRHRSMPNRATISNRIVQTISTAYDFQARLLQTLQEAQARLQEQIQAQRRGK